MDDEHYAFVGDYFTVLKRGSQMIDQRLMKVKVKYMSEEERKKHELLEQQKQIYLEEKRKKKELKE